MDFFCCSERWTCPSRPWFPLLNHHVAHLGCFHSPWPKWNYLLLRLKHRNQTVVAHSLNLHFLPAQVRLFMFFGRATKQEKFCPLVCVEVWHPYRFHAQNIPRESTAACEPVVNTFFGHSHSMHQDLDDELPYKGHRKWKKKIPQDECCVPNTNT